MTNPITPPPELVEEWANDSVPMNANAIGRDWEHAFATRAARWGANQELEACCEWVSQWRCMVGGNRPEVGLRLARRPKPPSLKEDALAALHGIHDQGPTPEQVVTIRRALEALDD